MEDKYIMNEPPIDELRAKVGNKFLLTCLIANRAKELSNIYFAGEPVEKDPKVIAIAAKEVYDGKIVADKSVK